MTDQTEHEKRNHQRTLAGVMLQHAVRAPWWDLRTKAVCLWRARAYARRSLGWPQ